LAVIERGILTGTGLAFIGNVKLDRIVGYAPARRLPVRRQPAARQRRPGFACRYPADKKQIVNGVI
jgi:hypothetical protein